MLLQNDSQNLGYPIKKQLDVCNRQILHQVKPPHSGLKISRVFLVLDVLVREKECIGAPPRGLGRHSHVTLSMTRLSAE